MFFNYLKWTVGNKVKFNNGKHIESSVTLRRWSETMAGHALRTRARRRTAPRAWDGGVAGLRAGFVRQGGGDGHTHRAHVSLSM